MHNQSVEENLKEQIWMLRQKSFLPIVQQRLNNCFQQIPVGVSGKMSKVLLHKTMDSFH